MTGPEATVPAAAPPRMVPDPARMAGLAIFAAAALLRFAYAGQAASAGLNRWSDWSQSDMATYLEQSRRIAAGDWLARDPYVPFHLWQSGPAERWKSWAPPNSLHQAPGYSYALALLRLATDRFEAAARLLQILAGALASWMVFLLARRLANLPAGIAAGLIYATHGPAVVQDSMILRESFSLLLLCAVLAALAGTGNGGEAPDDPPRRRTLFRIALAGGLAGALTLFHEAGQAVFAGGVLWAALAWRRGGAKGLLAALAAWTAGYAAGRAPWALRNWAAGAPLGSLSSRSLVVFAMSNHPAAPHGGAVWGESDWPGLAESLDSARGSLARMAWAFAADYVRDPLLLLKNWGLKIRCLMAPREAADNLSYSFVRERTALAALLPGFGSLAVPGIAGLALLALRARGEGKSDGAAGRVKWVLPAMGAAIGLALSLTHGLGRLRLFWLPCLAAGWGVTAAAGLDWALGKIRGRGGAAEIPGLRAAAAVFAVAGAVQIYSAIAEGPSPPRPSDYIMSARFAAADGDWAAAAADYRRASAAGRNDETLLIELGDALWFAGRRAESLAVRDRALRASPNPPPALLISLTWALSVAPEPELRDGDRAAVLGARAVAAAGAIPGFAWRAARANAAALAEAGRFAEAAAEAQRGAALAHGGGSREAAEEMLGEAALYRSGRARREGKPEGEAPGPATPFIR